MNLCLTLYKEGYKCQSVQCLLLKTTLYKQSHYTWISVVMDKLKFQTAATDIVQFYLV